MYAGFLMLIASGASLFFNRRLAIDGRPGLWRWIWNHRWNLGVLLGIASPFMGYHVSDGKEPWKVVGVPFPSAMFDAKGLDYVGPLTGPFMVLNVLFWLLLPQLVLWVTSGRGRRPGGAAAGDVTT